jgi:hypothetical protein
MLFSVIKKKLSDKLVFDFIFLAVTLGCLLLSINQH